MPVVRVEGGQEERKGARNCKGFSDWGRAGCGVWEKGNPPKSWSQGQSPGSLRIFLDDSVKD